MRRKGDSSPNPNDAPILRIEREPGKASAYTLMSLQPVPTHSNPTPIVSRVVAATTTTAAMAIVFAMNAGCNDSAGYSEPAPRPQIVNVQGPKDSVVTCDPKATGGACPLAISVTFRLPEDQFVWKAYVRFQGDGSDDGVDRPYLLEYTYGRGAADVGVTINAGIPPTILNRSQLFSYSVRLVTGAGEESTAAKLSVSVQ